MAHAAPTLMEMFAAVVAAPSVSSVSPQFDSGNREVSERLANWLADLGFRTELMTIPGHVDKFNVVAALGEGDGGLVLAGHSDTVPFDLERWNSDPFTLTEREGRLYGLGTCDMKGFFPLAIEAARRFRADDLRQPLTIVATADEESSMDGALELVKQGRPQGRYALIGEPTGLRPVRAHKGIIMESIRLIGRAGHSSDPSLGVSALEGMYQVLGELLAWREEMQGKHRNPLFAVPVPTLNLGHIHGGDNPNRICGQCELHIDLRPLPGMALEELRGELERRLRGRLGESALQLEIEPLFSGAPPMETAAASPIVRESEALTHQEAGAVAFCTEGPYFQQLGMETVILGPGDIDQAHQPDEYLEVARIEPTVALLEGMIRRFCVEPEAA
ncbi:acetylornithine deacetylase [Endothiovibrio diazotrophicus]